MIVAANKAQNQLNYLASLALAERGGGGGEALKAAKQSCVFHSFPRSSLEEDARVPWLCGGRRGSLQKTTEKEETSVSQ